MKRKKRIGLILLTEPRDGGEHQYAMLVVKCLQERNRIDYELIVLCGNAFWKKQCREMGIEYGGYPIQNISVKEQQFNYHHPGIAMVYNTYMTPLGKKIREEKLDILLIVQQHKFIPNYKVKIVGAVHDLMHRYESRFPELNKFDVRDGYPKGLARYAKCVLVDSKLGKKQFDESYNLGQATRRPRIISLPYVASEYVCNAEEEHVEVPEKYIFYPAQFWKHKNHVNLMRAICILRDTIPDIHLVLVGSDKYNSGEVRKFIEENTLEDFITILGFVSNGQLAWLYSHAMGMVMPSYFGPTNIPPLEAMALGCPVAVSDKYAMPEQVGKAGLLFNPDSPEEIADCIRKIWTDEKLRDTMRKRGYRRAKRWTQREFADKLQKIINII